MADVLDEEEEFIHGTKICSVPKDQKTTDPSSASKAKRDNQVVRSNGTWEINRDPNMKPVAQGQKKERPIGEKQYEYNIDLRIILMDVGRRVEIERPFLRKSPIESRDSKFFFKFHEDVGHETKDCQNLKRALDGLASKDFLSQYLRRGIGDEDRGHKKSVKPVFEDEGTLSDGGFVAVISGGLASTWPKNRGRKDYAQRMIQKTLSSLENFPRIEISEENH